MIQDLWIEACAVIFQLIIIILGIIYIHDFHLKAKMEQTTQFSIYAKIITASVEQTLGSGNGADKKEEARQALKAFTRGKLSEIELEHFIEGAVYEMNSLKVHKKI